MSFIPTRKPLIASKLWTPNRLLTLVGWFDPNDSTKISVTGNIVNSITDKVSSVVLTSSGSPQLVTLGSKLGIQFLASSSQYLENANSPTSYAANNVIDNGATSRIVVILARRLGLGQAYNPGLFYYNEFSPGFRGPISGLEAGMLAISSQNNWKAYATAPGATVVDTTNLHVLSYLQDDLGAEMYLDGYYQNLGTNSAWNSNPSAPIGMGRRTPPAANDYLDAIIGEIVVTASVKANKTVERQKLEGYLAWRWGIQSSLPSSHPHYYSPPV
ncbi:MAG: hypothetical protein IM561_09165 [Microcystis sp. M60BS1]|uniref:hypothetical protein n=1 Tax=unclassified Microcystis TaxID=2643300 RepID=UPI00257A614A|nr:MULTISPECIES: hypothetical protein [unclassified Microcystis]MCA2594390.1 hypothetical protein [Microcystis sp. M38BS1]MCA2510539.1 hypothetical protein [Microcystis sp. M60BS1]MCA2555773.1 hypothetical protein [Microcystis sp. M43BS1]MCA2593153.1 hypothetical protein [Microcystis sp. M31BS1]MCA2603398.1 hypothetical protein [Microcystis sp. M26BS1]